MAKVLLIAEHDGKTLNTSTAKCIACAAQLPGADIDVAVFAESASAIAAEAAGLESVSRVLSSESAANRGTLAAALAPQIVAMADGSALLGVNQVSDLMSVEGERTFKRPIYAGSAVVTVEVPADVPVVATIRTASFRAVGTGNSAPVEALDVAADIPDHTRYIGSETGKSDRPDLQSASRVVAGGRALGSEENFDLIYKLADKLEAGVGASRAAVDAGYVPNEMQVGQTGRIIAPDLYIAIGISGAIQHLTGIKDAGTIVAINKDEEAPIFEVADIGLVGDLFNVLPELTEALD
jgi:electron transfer flavoprotein alpha subunit